MHDNNSPEYFEVNPSLVTESEDLVVSDVSPLLDSKESELIQEPEVRRLSEILESFQSSKTKKYLARAALGLLAVGGVVSLATTHPAKILHEVEKAAPITVIGIAGSEVLWDVGAGFMLISAGKSIGNPRTFKDRWRGVAKEAVNSPLGKIGLTVNTTGALAMMGFVMYGGAHLAPDLWPGVAGLAVGDMVQTIAFRAPLFAMMDKPTERSSRTSDVGVEPEKAKKSSVEVRHATLEDIDKLADIDLQLFRKAYGQEIPSHEQTAEMLRKRYLNNPDWMFVSEVNGEVMGFVSCFRTNTPLENFVSWEQSTADGTLDGKVDPNGKYAYVTNMTVKSAASRLGARKMLLANLFANGIESGVEYAYFISRMPLFKHWLSKKSNESRSDEELRALAEEYVDIRRPNGSRLDPELKIYDEYGFKLERTVPNASRDDASLNFGVVYKAEVPPRKPLKYVKPYRLAYSGLLRQIAKHPKVLDKVIK